MEEERLAQSWRRSDEDSNQALLGELLSPEVMGDLDPFDAVQLAYVVTVCRQSKTVSEAGRRLFAVSRVQKKSSNDSDRLRKYLAKYELSFAGLLSDA